MQVEFKDILLKQLETKGGMNFDKDGVFPPSQFVTHKDEHWIFYGAASERHYSIGRDQRKALNYDDKYYRAKEFAWVPSSLVSTKIMSWEMLFIDRETGEYTVDKFLDYGEKEYGRVDNVLLWQAYPRIGFDERNQFDFYRDLPGGLERLRKVTKACHQRGVKVFIS